MKQQTLILVVTTLLGALSTGAQAQQAAGDTQVMSQTSPGQGTVVRTTPAANTQVPQGTPVDVEPPVAGEPPVPPPLPGVAQAANERQAKAKTERRRIILRGSLIEV